MGAPDWLTKEFLEKLLEDNQEYPGNKIVIINHEILQPLPKGSSHLGTIFRIRIEYTCTSSSISNGYSDGVKKITLIVKVPIEEGDLAPLNKWGVFDKELKAYNELLPKLRSIMHDNDIDILPKHFKTNKENTVILEDLSERGYTMGDRIQQLDYEHGLLTIKSLAKFHAASVRLYEIEPENIDRFGTELVFKKNMDDDLKKYMDPLRGEEHIEMICREFEKWPETKRFVDFLSKLKPKIWDLFLDLGYPSEDEFTVLNHGDLWTNNVLFKYDENFNPQALKFIDFQMLRSTSPTVDILFFFSTSMRYEVLKAHFNDLTSTYLEHLNQNLEEYGSSKRLDAEKFRKSLEKREIYSLIQCVNVLPYFFVEYKKAGEDEKPKDTTRPDYLKSERYRTVCAKYLEDFSKKSWFQNFE